MSRRADFTRTTVIAELLETMTAREVAGFLGCDVSTVYYHARKAREDGFSVSLISFRRNRRDWPEIYYSLLSGLASGLTVAKATRALGKSVRWGYTSLARMRAFMGCTSNMQLVSWAYSVGVLDANGLPKKGYRIIKTPGN